MWKLNPYGFPANFVLYEPIVYMPLSRYFLCLLWAATHMAHAADGTSGVRTGDLIFQQSLSGQSLAIQQATHSPYSHMGMIVQRKGQPFVLEAAATVRYTPLRDWIAHGENKRFVIKRLRDTARLTPAALRLLQSEGEKFLGRPYDSTFEWSDKRIYCSELVWKIYQRALGIELGEVQRLKTFDLSSPVVKEKLRERYGQNVPWDEAVISPAAMFDAVQLAKP